VLHIDWGHVVLVALLIVSVFSRFRHRDKRSLSMTFKWDKESSDETDGNDR